MEFYRCSMVLYGVSVFFLGFVELFEGILGLFLMFVRRCSRVFKGCF